MTVAQLIAELQKFPPGATVEILTVEVGTWVSRKPTIGFHYANRWRDESAGPEKQKAQKVTLS